MWPFDVRRNLQRKRIKEAFARYLSPELVADLAACPAKLELGLKPARIHFLLAQVRDDVAEDVGGHVSRAYEILMDANGMIDGSSSSLVVAVFGLPIWPEDHEMSMADRAAAVARLLGELGANVKIVTGDRDGYYGNVGSQRRFNFSFIVPEFGRCLETLVSLDYGEAAEAGGPPGEG